MNPLHQTLSICIIILAVFACPALCQDEDPNCNCGQDCGTCDGNTPLYMQITLAGLQGCPDYFHNGAKTAYPCFDGTMDIICKQDPNNSCGYYYIGPVFNMDGPPYDYRFKFYLDFSVAGETKFSAITQENCGVWYDAFSSAVTTNQSCDKTGSGNFFSYCNGPTPSIYSGSAYWRQATLADGNCPSCDPNDFNDNCGEFNCSNLDEYTMFAGPQAVYIGPMVIYSPAASENPAKIGNKIRTAQIYCPGANLVNAQITSSAPNDVIVSAEPQNCGQGDQSCILNTSSQRQSKCRMLGRIVKTEYGSTEASEEFVCKLKHPNLQI